MGHEIPMTVLIVQDKVPFLLGMETIRSLTNGIQWANYPVRRQWLEMPDGQQLDLIECTANGHVGIPWGKITKMIAPTTYNNQKQGMHKSQSKIQGKSIKPEVESDKGKITAFTILSSMLYMYIDLFNNFLEPSTN